MRPSFPPGGHGNTLKIVLCALVVALLAVVASGCGGGGRHAAAPPTTTTEAPAVKTCRLTAKQHRAVRRSLHDIRRLREIQKPLHTFSQRGTSAQESMTDRFLLDSANLPVNTRAHLLHLAKAAVGLCGLCFNALEAEEPVVSGRFGRNPCGPY
jgi:hypothetical protein